MGSLVTKSAIPNSYLSKLPATGTGPSSCVDAVSVPSKLLSAVNGSAAAGYTNLDGGIPSCPAPGTDGMK